MKLYNFEGIRRHFNKIKNLKILNKNNLIANLKVISSQFQKKFLLISPHLVKAYDSVLLLNSGHDIIISAVSFFGEFPVTGVHVGMRILFLIARLYSHEPFSERLLFSSRSCICTSDTCRNAP